MIISETINAIAALKEFILLTLFITILLSIVFLFQAKYYQYHKHKKNFISLFFQLENIGLYDLIFCYLYFLYIISILIRYQPIQYVHIFMFFFLTIGIISMNIKHRFVLYMIVNHILHAVALIVLNMICNYILNIRFEYSFLIIYIIGSCVLCVYCLYGFLLEIKNISKRRNEKWHLSKRKFKVTKNT